MRRMGQGIFVVAAAGVCACDRSEPPVSVVVRDSAQVRIIETSALRRSPADVEIAARPLFEVGQIEGEPQYLLSRVVGAMQLPNGSIVVGNGGTNELRFYDSTGKWLRTEGRGGEGPGEYEYLRALGRCRAGGFVAFDLSWQANSYDDTGNFIDKKAFRAPDGISPYNLACDERGHFLLLGWGLSTQGIAIGFYTARDRLVLTSEDGRVIQDLGQRLVSERIGTERGSRPHPAGRATLFAIHGDLLYVGSGERFEVELYGFDGALRTLVRGPAVPLATTDSIKAAYVEWAVSQAAANRQAAVRSEMQKWEWPSAVPAYTRLVVDQEGVAWLRAFNFDARESETWSLLDPNRGYLGDVALDRGMTLLEAGRDYVLVLRRDSLDVETVAKLALQRASAGPPN